MVVIEIRSERVGNGSGGENEIERVVISDWSRRVGYRR